MAKIEMLCPFSEKLCDECPLYRGRHYFLCFCKNYRGYIGKSRSNIRPGTDQHEVDFKALWKQLEPRLSHKVEVKPEIKLKVIDMETGKARFCELDEAKTWDWDNPEIMRMVGGYVHVTSWERLVELAARRAEKGYQEMDVYEGPRFMMLAGG